MMRWYTPAEVLKITTADNAELLALSGQRNPYAGKLGVVEQGALADLLLVDGDPIADINLIADPASNLVAIMKDGKVYKNSLKAKTGTVETAVIRRHSTSGISTSGRAQ